MTKADGQGGVDAVQGPLVLLELIREQLDEIGEGLPCQTPVGAWGIGRHLDRLEAAVAWLGDRVGAAGGVHHGGHLEAVS